MKVWISKFALTQGIYAVEGEPSETHPQLFAVKQNHTYTDYYHGEGKQWHRTLEGAKQAAIEMAKKKIASLKKKIKKIEAMKF